MSVTPEQIQRFADERLRPRCEQTRALLLSMEDDKVAITDIYEFLTTGGTWEDGRTDGPPSLLDGNDILAYNAFITDIAAAIRNHPQLPVILKACVRPVSQG